MRINIKWDSLLTSTLVVCAVVTTILVVRHEFAGPSAPSMPTENQKPVFIADWKSHVTKGLSIGPVGAPVQIIEFADFECPFCSDFHKKLKRIQERYPAQVLVAYVHFPIPGHRFALPAARVAECADNQGHFEAMYDQLYDGQDSFGLKPWSEYAVAAGIPDMPAFDSCIKGVNPIPRVEAGKELGAKLDVKGTPTIIINGWKLARPPSAEELDSMIKLVLAGQDPVSGARKP